MVYIPHYSRNRIAGHLLITIQKLISLKKYQGKCSNILEMLRQCINECDMSMFG
jgi:hypothetical protein